MSTPETDKLVQVFIRIRDARSERKKKFDEEDTELKEKLKVVEVELLRRAQEQGVEGFKTQYGTTYISEEVHASIADSTAFTDFLETQLDPYAFFESRPALGTLKKFQKDNDGAVPPGIRLFRENRMRVRAGKNKEG